MVSYEAHKRWRQKNQRLGLTADGQSRTRPRRTAEQRRAIQAAYARGWRKRNMEAGLTARGHTRVRKMLTIPTGVECVYLAFRKSLSLERIAA